MGSQLELQRFRTTGLGTSKLGLRTSWKTCRILENHPVSSIPVAINNLTIAEETTVLVPYEGIMVLQLITNEKNKCQPCSLELHQRCSRNR